LSSSSLALSQPSAQQQWFDLHPNVVLQSLPVRRDGHHQRWLRHGQRNGPLDVGSAGEQRRRNRGEMELVYMIADAVTRRGVRLYTRRQLFFGGVL
jgi:hypothetical protein